jgi:hypothetical protein
MVKNEIRSAYIKRKKSIYACEEIGMYTENGR